MKKGFKGIMVTSMSKNKEVTIMNRTIVVDFGSEDQYLSLIEQTAPYIARIKEFMELFSLELNHHPHCSKNGSITRFGSYPRKRYKNLKIWRIQCTECKAAFTVLPHFLPRYHSSPSESFKNALVAYHGGLSFENCFIIFHISPLSLYAFLCRLGNSHLVPTLAKTGLQPPQDFQVDEKHTKCLGEKAYIPLITEKHVVWHVDYTESLEEKVLETSYQEFQKEAAQKVPKA